MSEDHPPLPHALEELVEFVDTHDMCDYVDQMPEVSFEVAASKSDKSEAFAALAQELLDAFSPVDHLQFPPLTQLGEPCIALGDDLVTLISSLPLFCPEDLKSVLGKTLMELLGASDLTDADIVIYTLDVPVFETEKSQTALAEALGAGIAQKTKKDNAQIRSWNAERFASFTLTQASALEHWLRAVQDWPELTYIHDNVQSALGYWANRAQNNL